MPDTSQTKLNASLPDGVRLYVVGDVHGRFDLLQELSEQIREDAKRESAAENVEIFLGDYVDRGPRSKEVIDWLLNTPQLSGGRVCLKGGHEALLMAYLDDPAAYADWRFRGAPETLLSYGVSMTLRPSDEDIAKMREEFRSLIPDEHVAFLSSLQTSATYGDYLFVNEDIGTETPRDKMIVHGNAPVERAEFLPDRINVDTGAYIRNKLTCLVLEGDKSRLLHT